GLRIADRARDGVERSGRCGRIEEDLADEDDIMAASPPRGRKPLAEAIEGLVGYTLEGDEGVFFEAGDLARKGMEFAVARENAHSLAGRQRREQASEEIVRVGRERDRCRMGQLERGGGGGRSNSGVLARNAIVAGSGNSSVAAMPRCARGINSPKIVSHLLLASRAASVSARRCAAHAASGQK